MKDIIIKYTHLLLTVSVDPSILLHSLSLSTGSLRAFFRDETDMEVHTDTNQRQNLFHPLRFWKMLVWSLV
jgi:hypothetical protein